jgi:hypothetical protein
LPVDARVTDQTAILRLGAVGLTLAAGMSAWLEFWLLRRHLARTAGLRVRVGGGWLAGTAAAGIVAAVVAAGTRIELTGQPLLVVLSAAGAALAVTYLVAAAALRLPEIDQLWRLLHRR